jgi:hypothetical protein
MTDAIFLINDDPDEWQRRAESYSALSRGLKTQIWRPPSTESDRSMRTARCRWNETEFVSLFGEDFLRWPD